MSIYSNNWMIKMKLRQEIFCVKFLEVTVCNSSIHKTKTKEGRHLDQQRRKALRPTKEGRHLGQCTNVF